MTECLGVMSKWVYISACLISACLISNKQRRNTGILHFVQDDDIKLRESSWNWYVDFGSARWQFSYGVEITNADSLRERQIKKRRWLYTNWALL